MVNVSMASASKKRSFVAAVVRPSLGATANLLQPPAADRPCIRQASANLLQPSAADCDSNPFADLHASNEGDGELEQDEVVLDVDY